MTFELGRALLLSGAVSVDSLAQALFAVATQGTPLPRALLEVGAIGERRLAEELARVQVPVLQHVRPVPELMQKLPPGMCLRLAAVPVRLDPMTGKVDVAVLDARDPHPAHEIGYHLHAPVRIVRASVEALREALELHPGGVRSLAPPMGAPPERQADTLIWGSPAASLDGREPNNDATNANSPIPLSRRADPVRITGAWDDAADARRDAAEPVFELRRPPPSSGRARFKPSSGPPPPAFPLRAPLGTRVPTAPNAPIPPFADPATFLAGLKVATDRDAVVGQVILGARAVARKVGIFVVRKDSLAGWACTPEFGDEARLKALSISLNTPSLLTSVLAGEAYLGPLLGAIAQPLLRIMQSATEDVTLAAVRVSGRAALVIVADELGDTLLATQRIEELARAAGAALERIVMEKRGG